MAATESPICDLGWKAIDFDLEGIDGKRYRLSDVRGKNGTLVMFICNHCPYVKAVIERIVADVEELKKHGIGAIAIMPNDTAANDEDSFENMKSVAKAKKFSFPYVIDRSQATARAYDAACTPDFFGFNAKDELQYRGRLDASRTQPVSNARRELLEAMIAVSRTGKGPQEQLSSLGCSIKWRQAAE
ncbi:MAG: thioredoxin family protein [Alphaproteobacteria bacterium]|nr:thioredoxin family protein [Alphaproteobacteria bacterium]